MSVGNNYLANFKLLLAFLPPFDHLLLTFDLPIVVV